MFLIFANLNKRKTYFLLVILQMANEIKSSSKDNSFPGRSLEGTETKITEMCSFVADFSCSKCIELSACFWCASTANCYASIDKEATYNCHGRMFYKGDRCVDVYKEEKQKKLKDEKKMLLNLLQLLKKLRNYSNQKGILNLTSKKPVILNENNKIVNNTMLKNAASPINSTSNSILPSKSQNSSSANKTQTLSSTIRTEIISIKNLTHEKIFNDTEHSLLVKQTTNRMKNKTLMCHKIYSDFECTSAPGCEWCIDTKQCYFRNKETPKKCRRDHSTMFGNIDDLVKESCRSKSSCSACVESKSCFWCDSTRLCQTYHGAEYIHRNCKRKWHHGSCNNSATLYLIALPLFGCVLLLGVAFTCVKNCYYYQQKPVEVTLEERPILFKEKNGRKIYRIAESEEEEEEDERFIAAKSGSTYQQHGKNDLMVW